MKAGGLFAFGVSERAHGSDLLANEFVLRPGDTSGWIADGAKCYIGNANAAGIITIMARECDAGSTVPGKRSPLVFFALRPSESPGFTNLRKVRTLGIRNAFVGEFEVRGHPVPEGDIISRHREAWAAVFGTVDFGKFFLGFGAVGICEHAFAEVYDHLRRRILYGKPMLAMHHHRDALALAYSRMVAMKLYAYRALDYLQAAGPDDRRYVLFNAVQKARVSIEGLKVLGVLSECAGARGFEADTYIESALREGQMIPALEGSTHINFTLAAQFIGTYFADLAGEAPAPPGSVSLGKVSSDENPYWTAARDRNPKTTRFGHFLAAYESLRAIPNVGLFARGAEAFRLLRGCRSLDARYRRRPWPADRDWQMLVDHCIWATGRRELRRGGSRAHTGVGHLPCAGRGLDGGVSRAGGSIPAGRSTARSTLREISSVPETSTADLEAVSEWIAVRYGVAPNTAKG